MMRAAGQFFGFPHMTMVALYLRSDLLKRPALQSRRWTLVAVTYALFVASSVTVDASIIGPTAPQICLNDSTAAGAGGSSEVGEPPHQRDEQNSAFKHELMLLLAKRGPSSTSSNSGTSWGLGAGLTIARTCASPSSLGDYAIAGWVFGERRVALSTRPRNNLLRPPRA